LDPAEDFPFGFLGRLEHGEMMLVNVFEDGILKDIAEQAGR